MARAAPVPGTWSATGAMASSRGFHIAALLADGSVLVAGGLSGSGASDTSGAEMYSPTTGVWTSVASMVVARHNATATVTVCVFVVGAGSCFGASLCETSTASTTATVTPAASASKSPITRRSSPRTYEALAFY